MYKLYSKTNCSWCEKTENLLKQYNFPYEKYLYGKDYQREDLQVIVGEGKSLSVPQIVFKDKLIGGYEDFLTYLEDCNIMGTQQ